MHYLLLAFSLAAELTASTVRKCCTNGGEKARVKNSAENYLFSAVSSIFTFLVIFGLLVVTGGLRAPSLFTVLLGLLFGVVTALTGILMMCAFREGPMSYTCVLTSSSMIIPALFGVLFKNNRFSWVHVVGIIMMLICMALSVTKDQEQKKINFKWFFFTMLNFFMVGAVGIMQQVHQTSAYKEELNLFLLTAFLFSSIYSFCGYLFFRKRGECCGFSLTPGGSVFWLCGLVGVGVSINNIVNLYLSGVMNSAVFFPLCNGSSLILATLMGIFAFKEKFSAKKWAGLIIGIVAILLLCLENTIVGGK